MSGSLKWVTTGKICGLMARCPAKHGCCTPALLEVPFTKNPGHNATQDLWIQFGVASFMEDISSVSMGPKPKGCASEN